MTHLLLRLIKHRNLGRGIAAVLVAAIAGWAGLENLPSNSVGLSPVSAERSAEGGLQALFQARQSGIWTEVQGRVKRTLADDNEGSRHQRFILEDASGVTVLVAHNIDLAKRVPLRKDDTVTLYGRYEWNDKGGVMHWTHHDPQGREAGGWIEHAGQRYE